MYAKKADGRAMTNAAEHAPREALHCTQHTMGLANRQLAVTALIAALLVCAWAFPALGQGQLIGEASRQVTPPVSSPGGVLTAGLRGGPQDGGAAMCPPTRLIARSSTPNPLPSTCCDLKSSEAVPSIRTPPRTAAPRTTTAINLDIAALSPSPRGLEHPREATTTPTEQSRTRRSIRRSARPSIRTPRNTQTRTTRIPGKRPSFQSTPDPCSPWSRATGTTPLPTDDLRDRNSAISAGTSSFPRSIPRLLKRA